MYSKTRAKGGQSWERIRGGGEGGEGEAEGEERFGRGEKEERKGEESEKRRQAGVIKNSKCVLEKIKGRIGAKEENGKGD